MIWERFRLAVPSLSDAPATEAILTLTTCHPQFSNAERMIVHAMEVETLPKTAGAVDARAD